MYLDVGVIYFVWCGMGWEHFSGTSPLNGLQCLANLPDVDSDSVCTSHHNDCPTGCPCYQPAGSSALEEAC